MLKSLMQHPTAVLSSDSRSNSRPKSTHQADNSSTSTISPGRPIPPPNAHASKSFMRRMLYMKSKPAFNTQSQRANTAASVGPSRLREQDIRAEQSVQKAQAAEIQGNTNVVERLWNWTGGERTRFKEAVNEIQTLNGKLERFATIRELHHHPNVAASLVITTDEEINTDGRSVLALKTLESVICGFPTHMELSCSLGLRDNFTDFSKEALARNTYLELSEDTCLFPIKAHEDLADTSGRAKKRAAESVLEAAAQSSKSVDSSIKYVSDFLVGITSCGESVSEEQSLETQWDALRELAPKTQSNDPWYQHRFSLKSHPFAIKFFQHFPHSNNTVVSLREILADVRLRHAEMVGFRAHLACTIASFIFGLFSSEVSLSSRHLIFFLSGNSQNSEPELLARELTLPYLSNLSQTL